MTSRAHIHNADQAWMTWLRACTKLTGSSGASIYTEYSSNESAFQDTVSRLRSSAEANWPFLHNTSTPMSSSDIASARHRYLDKYPLTREQKCSAVYVDTLLEINQCQVRLRQGHTLQCKHCRDKDRTIATLRTLLTTLDLPERVEIDHRVIKSIFLRHFILNGVSRTTRAEVREVIQQAIQAEIDADEVLPHTSPAWREFLHNTLGASNGDSAPIRCLRRLHPLPLAHED